MNKKTRRSRLTKEEKHILECRDKWVAFGDRFGWTLHGFTFMHSASFFVKNRNYEDVMDCVDITQSVYESINEAWERGNG